MASPRGATLGAAGSSKVTPLSGPSRSVPPTRPGDHGRASGRMGGPGREKVSPPVRDVFHVEHRGGGAARDGQPRVSGGLRVSRDARVIGRAGGSRPRPGVVGTWRGTGPVSADALASPSRAPRRLQHGWTVGGCRCWGTVEGVATPGDGERRPADMNVSRETRRAQCAPAGQIFGRALGIAVEPRGGYGMFHVKRRYLTDAAVAC